MASTDGSYPHTASRPGVMANGTSTDPMSTRRPTPARPAAVPNEQTRHDDMTADIAAGSAHTCATRTDEGWLWYALKDPRVLRSTLFWIENHGRHGSPWNGRNNFADGLAASAGQNLLTRRGVPTAIEFKADKPTEIRYIQGVTRVPDGFGKVVAAEYAPGNVTFVDEGGKRVTVPVRHEFLSESAP